MGIFRCEVGFISNEETDPINSPGVWEDVSIKRFYTGELTRLSSKFQTSNEVNDNVRINTEISIFADKYALDHWDSIRYVTYGGVKWTVTNTEQKLPRLILSIGGKYNGYE